MRKITYKQRERIVRANFKHRTNRNYIDISRKKRDKTESSTILKPKKVVIDSKWKKTNEWMQKNEDSLDFSYSRKGGVILNLPREMDFSNHYDSTIKNIHAIRRLVSTSALNKKAYRLSYVNFDNVRRISTSAAIVLTAELSKWDDSIRNEAEPRTKNWHPKIQQQLFELGFFDLFRRGQVDYSKEQNSSKIRQVKYIKGKCGDNDKVRELKNKLLKLVNLPSINKWTFIASGLTEAITNVTHHAYPKSYIFNEVDKNWYLGGSFNNENNEIRIVFYDQGIGIPRSLPVSQLWERLLELLSPIPAADRMKDEVLLKAAVELDRTSTKKEDRGKGLQDLLEYVRQRKDGYISILSGHGLFKFTMENGNESTKTERFDTPILGTLIIWKVLLT